jgi:hypothetical protein
MKKKIAIFICLFVYNLSTIQAQNDTILKPKNSCFFFGIDYGLGLGYIVTEYDKLNLKSGESPLSSF